MKQKINEYVEKEANDLQPVLTFLLGMQQINRHPHDGNLSLFLCTSIRALQAAQSRLYKTAGFSS